MRRFHVRSCFVVVFGRITSAVGVGIGLVGCLEMLKIEGADHTHEYDLFYPESDDVLSGMGISKC